jgi:hypothetical protein
MVAFIHTPSEPLQVTSLKTQGWVAVLHQAVVKVIESPIAPPQTIIQSEFRRDLESIGGIDSEYLVVSMRSSKGADLSE